MPTKPKSELKPLIPPDFDRCQRMKSNGVTFMSMGGVPKLTQCESIPVVVVTENNPGPDGRKGAMSLCADCHKLAVESLGADFFTAQTIKTKTIKTKTRKVRYLQ